MPCCCGSTTLKEFTLLSTAHNALLPTPQNIGVIWILHVKCLNCVNNTRLQTVPHMMSMNLFFFFFCKQQSYILYQNADFKTSNMTLTVNDNIILSSCGYNNLSSRKMHCCQTWDLVSEAQDLSLNKQQLIHSKLSSILHSLHFCLLGVK
jgi:hypothetical protein